MIDGAIDWQERGLCQPKAVLDATKAYLASEDALSGWIEDCCTLGQSKYEGTGALFASWRKWAQAAGEKRLDSQRAFGDALDSRGIEPGKAAGVRVRHGIELTEEAKAEAEEAIKGWGN